ncbi:MAG: TfoX/Sxy family protein [Planctomycetota bacterium]|jgi:TfoX/Sxy family transcriptional regulator of competence genes
MAYDESVAGRIRAALAGRTDMVEKRMFGGIAFLHRGHMCCGVVDQELMLRLGKAGAADALGEPDTRPMDFTGKPLSTMVFVAPRGFSSDDDLHAWIDRAVAFVRTLPPK